MRIILTKVTLLLLSFVCLVGCKNEYYDRPEWLRGNAYEFMESRGNFTLYLKAAQLTGYDGLLNGQGLCTVFAPDDEAFSAWMQKNNYASLESIDHDKLRLIVGYHIVQQSFSSSYLLGFSQNTAAPTGGNGTAFKWKTYARENPKLMTDPLTKEKKEVFSREKFLPVFSTRLFKTKECADFEATYKYFFPNINWSGDNEKLHVCNAAIKESGIPTDNGYIYVLDDVVEPLRTIYQALEIPIADEFTIFRAMFDRFANLQYDEGISKNYGAPGERLHLYYHNESPRIELDLPEIASEWAYHGEHDGRTEAYYMYSTYSYNCFAPNDKALTEFMMTNMGGVATVEDIPQVTLYHLLRAHTDEQSEIILPDQIDRGLTGELGEKWTFRRNNIINHEFCANGILYGIDQVLVPTSFKTITMPLFMSSKYSMMTYMFHRTNQFSQLSDPAADKHSLFIQLDSVLVAKEKMKLDYGNLYKLGDENIKIDNSDMDDATRESYVQSHVTMGAVRKFNTRNFYATRAPLTYIYTKEVVAGEEERENGEDGIYDALGQFHKITKTWETINGPTYEIDGRIMQSKTNLLDVLRSSYSEFYNLLVNSELVKNNQFNKDNGISNDDKLIVFAPKNGFDKAGIPADKAALAHYLSYSFLSLDQNKLTDYILPGFGGNNTYESVQIDKAKSTAFKKVYMPISLRQNASGNRSVSIVNNANHAHDTNGDIPVFCERGLIYNVSQVIVSDNN